MTKKYRAWKENIDRMLRDTSLANRYILLERNKDPTYRFSYGQKQNTCGFPLSGHNDCVRDCCTITKHSTPLFDSAAWIRCFWSVKRQTCRTTIILSVEIKVNSESNMKRWSKSEVPTCTIISVGLNDSVNGNVGQDRKGPISWKPPFRATRSSVELYEKRSRLCIWWCFN